MKDEIIIAVVAALLTLAGNWVIVRAELKKSKIEIINESRIPLYVECYSILERNIADKNVVFQKDYLDELIKLKGKMKLLASNSVLQSFKNYYKWVTDIYGKYIQYCKETDPTTSFHIEYFEDGTELEIPDFNESDIDYWNHLNSQYIKKRNIDVRVVKSKTQDVLDHMRADLGNDAFKDDFQIVN